MADDFFPLDAADRLEVLNVATSPSGRPVRLLEKYVWVVWTLRTLFGAEVGQDLVFKGGTSLSKAYGAIRRFSEDVHLTCDIRKLVPDLVGEAGDALPATRSEEKRWSRAVRHRLPGWIEEKILPVIGRGLKAERLTAAARAEDDKVYIEYEPRRTTSSATRPSMSGRCPSRPRRRG